MAKGQSSFNTKTVQTAKRSYEPFEPGDYDLKVLGDTAEIRTAKPSQKNPRPVPYVSVHLEALGTAAEEGGKNRRVFHNFFLSLKGSKDGGPPMPYYSDQLKGFAEACGVHRSFESVDVEGISCISAKEVLKYLEGLDGTVVRGHVKIQKSKDFDPKNVVAEFYASEDEDEKDEDEDEDEDEKDEDEDEDEDEDDELAKAVQKKGKKR